MTMIDIYVDESSQTNHKYMVLGGVVLFTENVPCLLEKISEIRKEYNAMKELKWARVSKNKLHVYQALVETFFDQNSKDIIHFHTVIVDTHKINNHKFNGGDNEIGFNKFIYQLLLKFGRFYSGQGGSLNVYLDSRKTRHSLDELKLILNNGISKRWQVHSFPYKRVVFRDSKKTCMLQLNDILIGAIAYMKNDWHTKPDASEAKSKLSSYIVNQAGILPLSKNTPIMEKKFSIWNFQLK